MRKKNRSWRLNGRVALFYLFGLGGLLPLEDVAEAREQQESKSVVTQEVSEPKLAKGEYATDFGQGWYICPTSQNSCNMWNAYKVVNVDPYKNIQYQHRLYESDFSQRSSDVNIIKWSFFIISWYVNAL